MRIPNCPAAVSRNERPNITGFSLKPGRWVSRIALLLEFAVIADHGSRRRPFPSDRRRRLPTFYAALISPPSIRSSAVARTIPLPDPLTITVRIDSLILVFLLDCFCNGLLDQVHNYLWRCQDRRMIHVFRIHVCIHPLGHKSLRLGHDLSIVFREQEP